MSKTVKAPFTPEQVVSLNRFQKGKEFCPYECECRDEESHKLHCKAEINNTKRVSLRILQADASGLVCPVCDYIRTSVPEGVLSYAMQDAPSKPAAKAKKSR